MKLTKINALPRTKSGKGAARKVRAKGEIPAIIYGPTTDPIPVLLNSSEIKKALSSDSVLYKVTISNGGSTAKTVMLKEVQRDPLHNNIIHMDLYELDMDKKAVFSIPVVLEGTAKGVNEGGILDTVRREIQVKCFPNDIPPSIKFDVTEMEIGDSIHVSDIEAPEGVEIIEDSSETLAIVVAPSVMPEVEVAEEVEGEEGEAAAEAEEGAEEKPAEEAPEE